MSLNPGNCSNRSKPQCQRERRRPCSRFINISLCFEPATRYFNFVVFVLLSEETVNDGFIYTRMLLRLYMLPSYPLQSYLSEPEELWSRYHSLHGTRFTPLIILVDLFGISPSFSGSLRAMRPALTQHSQHRCTMGFHSTMFPSWLLLFVHKHLPFNWLFQTLR